MKFQKGTGGVRGGQIFNKGYIFKKKIEVLKDFFSANLNLLEADGTSNLLKNDKKNKRKK